MDHVPPSWTWAIQFQGDNVNGCWRYWPTIPVNVSPWTIAVVTTYIIVCPKLSGLFAMFINCYVHVILIPMILIPHPQMWHGSHWPAAKPNSKSQAPRIVGLVVCFKTCWWNRLTYIRIKKGIYADLEASKHSSVLEGKRPFHALLVQRISAFTVGQGPKPRLVRVACLPCPRSVAWSQLRRKWGNQGLNHRRKGERQIGTWENTWNSFKHPGFFFIQLFIWHDFSWHGRMLQE